ncbi:hypothetical protein [Natronobeatus ordinarius]|nr:hypothetical protein [Natronobeatus ordinarius]
MLDEHSPETIGRLAAKHGLSLDEESCRQALETVRGLATRLNDAERRYFS